MQVLHLHWLTPTQPGQHGRFFLWAETTATTPPSRDRRKKSAQPHPFASDSSELRALLKSDWLGGQTAGRSAVALAADQPLWPLPLSRPAPQLGKRR